MQRGNRLSNEEFARELERRTRQFAVRIIRLSAMLPHSPEGKVLRNQITKSGTSIGANYREANRARSRAEFNNRIKICESEASETQYWLEVICEAGFLAEEEITPNLKECTELLAIFTSIANAQK
ncbi:MAG: four helix bundle protein [Proteobacteria bacterium]|nr:four helix bundle protein [Pseudomonadota bacterium]MBU1687122.1 four helix bundle protein [Pseudomonadota bacterium]